MAEPYLCERCKTKEAIAGQRWCANCKKLEFKKMREEGYFLGIGDRHIGERRPNEMREKIYETKYGTGH